MKHNYFITGYPGFLAARLIEQLILDHEPNITKINLLVLPDVYDKAYDKITNFSKIHQINPDFFNVIQGDITKPNLTLDQEIHSQLQHSVTHVFHLAAIYDLAVPKIDAFHVNVHGTREVNEWVETLPHLQRYIYFSTAYVSGKREGKIYENELSQGQDFKNHYEKTKYDAELMVNNLKKRVPVTIIRPGIVKGHSKTGETIKFDGLYFLLNFLDKMRFLPVVPYLGHGEPEGNFVPEDYVLKATSFLAINPIGEGKTYHLTDPHPYTMKEIYKMLSKAYLGRSPKGTIPISVANRSLSSKKMRQWLQVEKEALDYFTYKASYDSTETIKDLEGSGIVCPDLKETIDPMIQFYKQHKNDKEKQIKIN